MKPSLARLRAPRAHGPLFAPYWLEFAGEEKVFSGAMSDPAALRNYAPKNFLSNLIWNTRGERPCFQFGPNDMQDYSRFMDCDSNTQIVLLTGVW